MRSVLALLAAAVVACCQSPIFVEDFASPAPPARWSPPTGAISWSSAAPGGWRYNTSGPGVTYAAWPVGAGPFHLKFDHLLSPGGNILKEVRNGGALIISTDPPGSQTPFTVNIVMGANNAGLSVSVRKGVLFGKDAELSLTTKEAALYNTKAFANFGLACGSSHCFESVPWPQSSNSGKGIFGADVPVTLEVTRSGDTLTLAIYHPWYYNGTRPYWTVPYPRTYTLQPPDSARPFGYIIVQSVPNPDGAWLTGAYGLSGVITNIRAYGRLDIPAPGLTGILPSGRSTSFQSGSTVSIAGTGFDQSLSPALKLGTTLAETRWVSATQLTAVLPPGANGTSYTAKVVLSNGLEAQLPGGLTYSAPTITRIDPHEVSPAGGDTVVVTGAGFDDSTSISFNGHPARCSLTDPLHLSCTLAVAAYKPALDARGVRVLARSNGSVFFDSAASPSTLAFGYAPHPYMLSGAAASAATLASLRSAYAAAAASCSATPTPMCDHVRILERNISPIPPNAAPTPAKPIGSDPYDGLNSASSFWIDAAYPPPSLFYNINNWCDYFWMWFYTGNQSSFDKWWTEIQPELTRIEFTDHGNQSFFFNYVVIVALAYDVAFPQLTAPQRTAMLNYLDRVLTYYHWLRQNHDSFAGGDGNARNNWIAIGSAGGGVTALAMAYSYPAASTEYNAAASVIKRYSSTFIGPDGGNPEGSLYSSYGEAYYYILAEALQATTGSSSDLLSPTAVPGATYLPNQSAFVETLWGADGTWFTFNDTQPQSYGMNLAEMGKLYSSPGMIYLGDFLTHQIAATDNGFVKRLDWQVSSSIGAGIAFWWRAKSPVETPSFPGWPVVAYLPDTQLGVLRSSPDLSPKLTVGIKGKGMYSSIGHDQADTGSFVLQAKPPSASAAAGLAETFLIDPGYNMSAANQHSIPEIDGSFASGNGQPGRRVPAQTTTFIDRTARDTPPLRCLQLDETATYNSPRRFVAPFNGFVRTFVLYKDLAVIVLDDINPTGAGSVISYFQTGFPTLRSGNAFFMTGKNAAVKASLYGPTTRLSLPVRNSFGTASWVFGSLGVEWYTVAAYYSASALNPLVTVFTVAERHGTGGLTSTFTNDGAGNIKVTMSDGGVITFTNETTGWVLQ